MDYTRRYVPALGSEVPDLIGKTFVSKVWRICPAIIERFN